jgi:hypothetical protein
MSDEQNEFVVAHGQDAGAPPWPQKKRAEGMTAGARHAVIFLFVLTFLTGAANLLWTSRQTGAVRKTAASQIALCQAGNVSRAQQIDLWEFVIRISGPSKTAAGRRVTAQFEQHLHAVFAPRDCARLTPSAERIHP